MQHSFCMQIYAFDDISAWMLLVAFLVFVNANSVLFFSVESKTEIAAVSLRPTKLQLCSMVKSK